jgi:hypothetical protein
VDDLSRKLLLFLGWSAVGAVAVLTLAEPTVVDLDLWGLMAMGRETLLWGWPPTQDPFAYVPTKNPFVYHEWLSGVLFYLVLEDLGSWAFKPLLIALGLSTVGLAALAGRRLGASYLSLLIVLVMSLLPIQRGYSPIRAQALTFFFFALFVFLLEEARNGRHRLLLIIPLVTVVWANLHGGFVAGIGLLCLYIVSHFLLGQRPWLLMGVCFTAILGTLLNPYGLDYWQYLRQHLLMPRPYHPEWAPLRLDFASGWAFTALALISALSFIGARRRYWPGFIVMGVTAFLGFRSVRFIPFFAIAAIAYLPVHLSPLLDRVVESCRSRLDVRPLLATLLASVMLFGLTFGSLFHLAVLTSWQLTVPVNYYPVGAVEFLRVNGLEGNLATPFNWGQYVLWKLYPKVKISHDGRYETVYPEEVSEDNFNFIFGKGSWRRLLTNYPTEMVLVDKSFPVTRLMDDESGWSNVYEDGISAVYLPTGKTKGRWAYVYPENPKGTIP